MPASRSPSIRWCADGTCPSPPTGRPDVLLGYVPSSVVDRPAAVLPLALHTQAIPTLVGGRAGLWPQQREALS